MPTITPHPPLESGPQLQHLQNKAWAYFQYETNPHNGLVADKTAFGTDRVRRWFGREWSATS